MGLGNPGTRFAGNRHNLGFMCLSHFAKTHNIRLDKKKGEARIGYGEVDSNKLAVARPQTHMNRSGQAVKRLINALGISQDNLIVIHDDLDLPLGSIRIRQGGSPAGHKGVDSIAGELGSRDFIRIRAGIGRPFAAKDDTEISDEGIITYVLGDFTAEEKHAVNEVIPRVSEAILCLLTEGLDSAMNKYNQRIKPDNRNAEDE